MPATTNSDKFLNAVPRWTGQVGAAGVSSSTATVLPLQSTTGLTNGRAYFFTFNRLTGTTKNPVSSTEGLVGVVNTSTNEITTTLANRGLEGAAQAWAAGTLVEILHSAGYMNRFIEGLEVSLNQDGTLKSTALDGTKVYAADAGSTDDYAITLSPAPTAYVAGQTFRFKANTANTGSATLNVNALGAKTIKKNYNSDLATGDILANQLAEVIYDGTNFQLLSPVSSNTSGSIITTSSYGPEGLLINGKIVPSVSSNNLTVALKGMDGNDPSASNPVYVRINNVVYSITSPLSLTANSGTSYLNLGSTELVGKEVDLFSYLWLRGSEVRLAISRIPYATVFDDFTNSTTAEKGWIASNTSGATSGDPFVNIGRFATTLNSSNLWATTTYTAANLIQRPTYETRWLSYVPTITWTASVAPSGTPGINQHKYKIVGSSIFVSNFTDGYSAGTAVTRVQITTPLTASGFYVNSGQITNSDTPNNTTGYVTSGGVMNLFSASVSATRFTNVANYGLV